MTKARDLSELMYKVSAIEAYLASGAASGGDCEIPFVTASGAVDMIPLSCTGSDGGDFGGDPNGVTQLVAGNGIAVSPELGVGVVTVVSTATLDFVLTTGEEKPIPLS
jgi:hypothetical protein